MLTLLRDFGPYGMMFYDYVRALFLTYYNSCQGNAVKGFSVLWFALMTTKPLPSTSD
jgi:hypothetical protein